MCNKLYKFIKILFIIKQFISKRKKKEKKKIKTSNYNNNTITMK